MQFLYRIQPVRPEMLTVGPTPSEVETLGRHFAYLETLAAKGDVLLAGRTLTADADSFGIVLFTAETEESARILMEDDPAVHEGIMRAQLFPYRIAVTSLFPREKEESEVIPASNQMGSSLEALLDQEQPGVLLSHRIVGGLCLFAGAFIALCLLLVFFIPSKDKNVL
jgi:uncharacterized protein YciI